MPICLDKAPFSIIYKTIKTAFLSLAFCINCLYPEIQQSRFPRSIYNAQNSLSTISKPIWRKLMYAYGSVICIQILYLVIFKETLMIFISEKWNRACRKMVRSPFINSSRNVISSHSVRHINSLCHIYLRHIVKHVYISIHIELQLSAVITRSSITRYCIHHHSDRGRI